MTRPRRHAFVVFGSHFAPDYAVICCRYATYYAMICQCMTYPVRTEGYLRRVDENVTALLPQSAHSDTGPRGVVCDEDARAARIRRLRPLSGLPNAASRAAG